MRTSIGKLRFRLGLAQLGEHLVGIRVGLHVEVHGHPHQPVVGVEGIHVVHVVHAAHLLLDRRGHGLLDRQGVGAHISGLNEDFGGTILGYCATGSPDIATRPTMTVMIAMTIATMGRLMKKRYMTVYCPAAGGRRAGEVS